MRTRVLTNPSNNGFFYLLDAQPLLEPMLALFQSEFWEEISVKFEWNTVYMLVSQMSEFHHFLFIMIAWSEIHTLTKIVWMDLNPSMEK